MKRIAVVLSLLLVAVALVWAGEKVAGDKGAKKEEAKKMEQSKDTSAAKDTAKEAAKEPEWITTETGLKYADLVVGDGDEVVPGSKVQMHYTLWLANPDGSKGKKIQSSKDTGQPFTTTIPGRLIAAWNQGIPGMKVGGTRLLLAPPELAYGKSGMGGMIPPNATLYFEVECLKIIK